jgi:GAF domain-containing protein/HAMP domain-containing protein
VGTSLAGSPLFEVAQSARDRGRSELLDVRRGSLPQLYAAYVYELDSGNVVYLAGELEISTIITQLAAPDALRESFSYLVAANGTVIAAANRQSQSIRRSADPVIQAALEGRASGSELIVDEGRDYVIYFQPVANSPFMIVTEATTQAAFTPSTNAFVSGVTPLLLILISLAAVAGIILSNSIVAPLRDLQGNMRALADGDFDAPLPEARRGDEIGSLMRTYVTLRSQMRALVEDFTERIGQRVRDVQATQEVSRFVVSQRDTQTLLDNVVNLIVEFFPSIYHAQIFLIDSESRWAVLRSSTGEAGRQLLARGHRLAVGSVSVIGQVTGESRVVAVRDIGVSEVHRRNEFLPETRAELAIPLRVGGEVIGALDVQSKQSGSAVFSEDQISVLQTLADQIAVAIENARLYQETVSRLEQVTIANRQETLRAWTHYLDSQRTRSITAEAGTRLGLDLADVRQIALDQGMTVVGEITERSTIPVAVPIELRGQVLGSVEWEFPSVEFSQDKVLLAQELVGRLAVSLDNARLFQESQLAINRERLVNEISARITAQTDINAILQTAVREVGQALRAPQVNIHLRSDADAITGSANGAGDTQGIPGSSQGIPGGSPTDNGHASGQ